MNDCPSQEEISLNYFPVVLILLLRLVVFVAIRALLIWFFRLKKGFFSPHPLCGGYLCDLCPVTITDGNTPHLKCQPEYTRGYADENRNCWSGVFFSYGVGYCAENRNSRDISRYALTHFIVDYWYYASGDIVPDIYLTSSTAW